MQLNLIFQSIFIRVKYRNTIEIHVNINKTMNLTTHGRKRCVSHPIATRHDFSPARYPEHQLNPTTTHKPVYNGFHTEPARNPTSPPETWPAIRWSTLLLTWYVTLTSKNVTAASIVTFAKFFFESLTHVATDHWALPARRGAFQPILVAVTSVLYL